MPKRDYYEVLGLARDATDAQVRSAYRKKARQHHPDVSKSPDAAQKFKEATEAYEVLSDAQKRKKYDQFGHAGGPGAYAGRGGPRGYSQAWPGAEGVSINFEDLFGRGGGGFSGMSLEEVMEALGGGGARRRRSAAAPPEPRGEDTESPVTLEFLDAVRGTTADLRLRRPGAGEETLRVKIPPGVHEGQRIRLRGKGHGGGDLYIVVHVREHPYFRREGGDLYLDLPISVTEAVLGAEVEVPTLDGTTRLKVPPGTSGSRQLRLRGLGVPSAGGGPRGDQYVVIKIVVPSAVSEEGGRLLRQFGDLEKFNPRRDVPWNR